MPEGKRNTIQLANISNYTQDEIGEEEEGEEEKVFHNLEKCSKAEIKFCISRGVSGKLSSNNGNNIIIKLCRLSSILQTPCWLSKSSAKRGRKKRKERKKRRKRSRRM